MSTMFVTRVEPLHTHDRDVFQYEFVRVEGFYGTRVFRRGGGSRQRRITLILLRGSIYFIPDVLLRT